jgi:hypothetical protein
MGDEEFEFIEEMVSQLDETIKHLCLEEQQLESRLGVARTAELREYWDLQMDIDEAQEFKPTLDYWDKMLIYVWSRLRRAHTSRALAGQAIMKQKQIQNSNHNE